MSLVFLNELCYGQGWQQSWVSCHSGASPFSENEQIRANPINLTNDGGCIVSHFQYPMPVSSFSVLDRFDRNGHLIWNARSFYSSIFSDSNAIYSRVLQALQLPNDNIVLQHNPGVFSLIDNYGNKITNVFNRLAEDTFNFSYTQGKNLFYNSQNNTFENVGFVGIGNAIYLNRDVYALDFQKTEHHRIFLTNHDVNFTNNGPITGDLVRMNDNYIFHVYGNFQANSGDQIIKCTQNGALAFSTFITKTLLISNTDTALISSIFGSSDYTLDIPYAPYYDFTVNKDGQISLVAMVSATLNSVTNPRPILSCYLIINYDAAGNIMSKKTILRNISDPQDVEDTYAGHPAIWSINRDSLLVFGLDSSYAVGTNKYLRSTTVLLYNRSANTLIGQKSVANDIANGCFLRNMAKYWPFKVATADNQFLYAGMFYSDSLAANSFQPIGIAKIDNRGYASALAEISGNVFNDLNDNCIKNAGERNIPFYTVDAANGNSDNFGITDINGDYFIGVKDTGNYTVSLRSNSRYPYFNANCSSSENVLVRPQSTNTINYAVKADQSCVSNTVNISVNSLHRCAAPGTHPGEFNVFTVSYCNNGSAASINTYIDITLDRLLTINSASIPYTAWPNNIYSFYIGLLDYLNCGTFTFNAIPNCDSTILGQTLCVEAHIYPDTICGVPSYTGPVITSSAQCLGDSVKFQLHNVGLGNMAAPKHYIVIEDNVLRINRSYQLNANQTLTETIHADSGRTYRIRAEEPDELPGEYGDRYTTAAVENCQPSPGNFHTGFFTQFPNYDGEPYRAMSCNIITGSFDPNEKTASPVGYAAQHYIEANTQIDYQIDFQNTGNDTAFKVVIVDTISSALDINSIQLEVASHNYQFQRTDSNVVQFVFDSINLVDSFRNETLSHGFVKFKIQQKPNNPDGTKIYNKADIYFDYNTPITTNQTYHTVGHDFVTVDLITEVKNVKYNVREVKVYPNPFRDKTQIMVDGDKLTNAVLQLISLDGSLLKTIFNVQNTFSLERTDLPAGFYFYKIFQENETIATGKLIVQ